MTFGPEEIAKAVGTEFVASGPFTDDIITMHPTLLKLYLLAIRVPFKFPCGEERDDEVVSFVMGTWGQSVRGIENSLQKKEPLLIPWLKNPRLLAVTPRSATSRGGLAFYSRRLANLPAQAPYEAPTYPKFRPPPCGDDANE
ncbi:hypothetical protein RHSIM_Rhsim06G0091100 [Rhododendron simsii]|uniref:Uncharacterized protein n=1 Tax=Rhododendron simsii TaxID=118357 RepID=A0A834GU54_RHOSS|nr:hypothetical protein RHSIM_Rhsim06G0091100 [Rhododendron simsii]